MALLATFDLTGFDQLQGKWHGDITDNRGHLFPRLSTYSDFFRLRDDIRYIRMSLEDVPILDGLHIEENLAAEYILLRDIKMEHLVYLRLVYMDNYIQRKNA